MTTPNPTPKHKPKGFAAIDPQRRREIAAMGGRAAHRLGTAHQFTSEEAKRAGRKGGLARWLLPSSRGEV